MGKSALKLVLVAVGLITVPYMQAAINWQITEGAHTIQTGDAYGEIYIYETEPVQTVVTMNGGTVGSIGAHNGSVFNLHSGTVGNLTTFDNATMNLYGGTINYGFYGWATASQINIYYLDDFSTVYEGSGLYLSGKWEDGSDFNICFFRALDGLPENVIMHKVPEPTTILLLAIGGFFLKRRRN